MTQDELIPFLLKQVPLFESFGQDSVESIVDGSELRTFEGNESIIQCGDEGRFIGVLIDGHGEISIADNTGGRIVMSPLEVGDVFGEMSVLTGDRTVADVIAGNRCLVLLIPQDVVSSHILVNPKAILYLSKLLADRARAQAVDVTSSQLRARALAQSDDPYALSLKKEVHGKILSINAGLSQIRFGIYDTHDEALDVHGVVDCADCESVHITMTAAGKVVAASGLLRLQRVLQCAVRVHARTRQRFLFTPLDVIAVGHRVVHGGSKFSSATVITPQVLADIEALAELAPLHNPHNLEGMREAMKFFPGVPHVAVFDTAFHQTLPTYAYLYGLPYEWYKKEGIRRYGFHGTSHRYVSLKAAEVVKRPLGELEIISCHLGVGASMCAIDHGRSVDTTMGMTPSDGLIMPSRSGSLDPAIMIQLMERYKLGPDELNKLINSESGLKGISGISSDIHEIEAAAAEGHHRALLAHKAFCYQIRKNIGAYVAAMGGVSVLAFTGDIGETSPAVRSLACQGLAYMGIKLDEDKNSSLGAVSDYAVISADDSPVTIIVVANNDERLLAWEACVPSSATRSRWRSATRPRRRFRSRFRPTTCIWPRPTSTSCSAPATS
jgi:acetate kinase